MSFALRVGSAGISRAQRARRAAAPRPPQLEYDPHFAVRLVKANAYRAFVESVDVSIRLGIDPRKTDQHVRGTCALPAGVGKQVRLCMFVANEEERRQALQAGVDSIGDAATIAQLEKGAVTFDKVFATLEGLTQLKPHARVLGPKGLFPNVKSRTLLRPEELEAAVREAKQGTVEFRSDATGRVMAMIGKVSFSDAQLLTNLTALLRAVEERRPRALRGRFFRWALMRSTGGQPVRLHLPFIEPGSAQFMQAAAEGGNRAL